MKKIALIFFLIYSSTNYANQCSNLFADALLQKVLTSTQTYSPESIDFYKVENYVKEYKNQNINGKVYSYFESRFGTRLYVSNNAIPDINGIRPLVDQESEAVIIFLHGSGTIRSSGKNFIHIMNSLLNLNISSIALDLPFHADGPSASAFEDPKYLTAWINKIVIETRKAGVPVYLAGHSFGPSVAIQYMYDYPFGVDGALLISPVAFNDKLKSWYKRKTSKMKFGESQLISDTMGGLWGDRMLNAFQSHLSPGAGDPTLINPQLKIYALTGDSEEYADAPTGGRRGLPTGKNTYSIPAALSQMFSRIKTTVAENIGHYIFKHTDRDGKNSVLKALLDLIGIKIENEAKIREKYLRVLNQERTSEEQLWYKFYNDQLFQSWATKNNLVQVIRQVFIKKKSQVAKNILEAYRDENENYKAQIVARIIKLVELNPNLSLRFKNDLEDLKKYGLRDCPLIDEVIDQGLPTI